MRSIGRLGRRSGSVALVLAAASLTIATVGYAAPPLDDPALAWSTDVPACADPARRCVLTLSDELAVVTAAPVERDEGSTSIVTALDLESGKRRWHAQVAGRSVLALGLETAVVGDKDRVSVLDASSGAVRFTIDGHLIGINDYGTMVMAEGDTVRGLDARTGDVLWTGPDGRDAAIVCRDVVVLVPAAGEPAAPFEVREQHTGALRWRSDADFDPARDILRCGGQSLYAATGDELTAWYTFDEWPQWSVPLPRGAAALELYREVALVTPDDGSGVVVAVDREAGDVVWERPIGEIGDVVSSRWRLRHDATGLFTLHPMTGDVVAHTPPTPSAGTARVLGLSESRVLLEAGAVVTAYGTHDLGLAWTLVLDAVPDEAAVSGDTLVVRIGTTVSGYR